jgi:tyrosyl-tRNA synthetase
MSVSTDKIKIQQLLSRGVDEIIDKKYLEKRLKSGEKLRVKLGIDPTSPNLHLGRSVPLLKLRDFQDLGHHIVFIVGDATGVIGDTSDKEAERPMLSRDVIKENLKSYKKQVAKILDIKKVEFVFNSKWLNKLGHKEIGEQAEQFGLGEFVARDNIRRRLDEGKRVSVRELLYPLMQGYDSVAVKADVELGGTDQRFNLLAGRTLQKYYGQEPQDILMNPLVEGSDGRKMSSSWGNTINFTDEPNDMYGKVMSVGDDLIVKYFEYFTRVPIEEVSEIKNKIETGGNPKDSKMKLAREIVRMYHDEKEAVSAEAHWVSTFSKKEMPDDMPELKPSAYDIVTVLVESDFCKSKSDARRAIEQGGVRVNGEKVSDDSIEVKSGEVVQKGKRYFVKLK